MVNINIQNSKKVAFECIKHYEDNSSTYFQDLIRQALGKFYNLLLNAEFIAHIGYEKSASTAKESSNRRNGFIHKKVKSSFGIVEIMVPRDRDGSFEPISVRKHSRAVSSTESKVFSMFAQGITQANVELCLQKMFGYELPAQSVHLIQEQVLSSIKDMGVSTLKSEYAFVSINKLDFTVVKEINANECDLSLYVVLGVDEQGNKDILHIFLSPPYKKKSSLDILKNLQARGVKNIVVIMSLGIGLNTEDLEQVFPYTSLYLSNVAPKF